MSNMKRQHLISLLFLAVMVLWIGGAAATNSLTGPSGSSPPSIVIEKTAQEGEVRLDEHHQDRFLDWKASPHADEAPHYSPRQESRYSMTSENGPPSPQLSDGSVCFSRGGLMNTAC